MPNCVRVCVACVVCVLCGVVCVAVLESERLIACCSYTAYTHTLQVHVIHVNHIICEHNTKGILIGMPCKPCTCVCACVRVCVCVCACVVCGVCEYLGWGVGGLCVGGGDCSRRESVEWEDVV